MRCSARPGTEIPPTLASERSADAWQGNEGLPAPLLRLLGELAVGDVMTVTRIDRLARSIFDPFAIVKRIVDAGGQFRHWPSRGRAPPPAPGG